MKIRTLSLVRFGLLASALGLAVNAAAQSSGTLDSAFGLEAGLTASTLRDGAVAIDVVAMPDGGWVSSGYASVDNKGKLPDLLIPMLARYAADGTPDRTFGADGIALSSLAFESTHGSAVLRDDARLYHVVSNGKQLHVIVYTLRGRLDTAYGSGGIATFDAGGPVFPVIGAVLQNGRVLIAASGSSPSSRFMLARLNQAGQLDPSFGSGGISYSQIHSGAGSANLLTDVALQADGKIVTAGRTKASASPFDMVVGRFHANGAPDLSFGNLQGFQAISLLDRDLGRQIAVQPDGKIVIAGTTCATMSPPGGEVCTLGAARLLANGALDPGFGADGKVIDAGADLDEDSSVYGLAVDANNRAIIAGSTYNSTPTAVLPQTGFLVRLTAEGALDSGFGFQGTVKNVYENQHTSTVHAVVVTALNASPDPTDRLITVGTRAASPEAKQESVIARHFYDDGDSVPSE